MVSRRVHFSSPESNGHKILRQVLLSKNFRHYSSRYGTFFFNKKCPYLPPAYKVYRGYTVFCLFFVCLCFLIVLGFNDTSTLEGHFVSSPREREKRDRREIRGDEREGQGRKRNRNESEETEEIKTFPLYPYPLQG